MRLQDRNILITGAASGIGRATAQVFANAGARLALLDKAWKGVADSSGPRSYACDLTDEVEVVSAVEMAVHDLGGLDGVVNCAGISLRKSIEDTTFAEWNDVIGVNLSGPFLVCRAALPALKASGRGTIVNVCSGASFRPSYNFGAYCASKGGLLMLTRSLAFDLAQHNIRVNAVCPGVIDTPMIERAVGRSPDPAASVARFKANAFGRYGSPEEIANVILFLTSNDSSFVTGSAYGADGGLAYH